MSSRGKPSRNSHRSRSATSNTAAGLRCPFSISTERCGSTESHSCGGTYKDIAKLNEHIKRVHSLRYTCEFCPKIFNITPDKDLKLLQERHAHNCQTATTDISSRSRNNRLWMTREQHDRWSKWKEQRVRTIQREPQTHTSWRRIYKSIHPDRDAEQALDEMLQGVQPVACSSQPVAASLQNDYDISLPEGRHQHHEGGMMASTDSESVNKVLKLAAASRTQNTMVHEVASQVVYRDDQVSQWSLPIHESFPTLAPGRPISYGGAMMVNSGVEQQQASQMSSQSQAHTGPYHSYLAYSHSQSVYSHSHSGPSHPPSMVYTDITAGSSNWAPQLVPQFEQTQTSTYLSHPYPLSHESVSVGGGDSTADSEMTTSSVETVVDRRYESTTMLLGMSEHLIWQVDQAQGGSISDENQDDSQFHQWAEGGRE